MNMIIKFNYKKKLKKIKFYQQNSNTLLFNKYKR